LAQLPIAPITRIIRNAGAERVSEDASLELVNYLGGSSKRISKKAVSLAKHAGRKTVKRGDILLAFGSSPERRVSRRRTFGTPIKPITRMIRNAGAERVSKDASLELVNYIENTSKIISKRAVSLAKHAGRKTVKSEDIIKSIMPESIVRKIREAPSEAIVIEGNKLQISSKKLASKTFYKLPYLGEELVVEKSPDKKIRIFEVLEE
jgi:histone H3/H4